MAEVLSKSKKQGNRLLRTFAMLLLLALACAVCTAGVLFPALREPACMPLIRASLSDSQVQLPGECRLVTSDMKDATTSWLESSRVSRGLSFRAWITCDPPERTAALDDWFERDPAWLPTYVASAYQLRRTVVILRPRTVATADSNVSGEVGIMPWGTYLAQISGECRSKFAAWR